jgi:hypothetical protein
VILPQDIDLNFTIQAFDGDGDPTSTSNLLVQVDAQNTSSAAASSSELSSSESMLLASNDNSTEQRLASNGNNIVLTAALAAAGLSAEPLVASAVDPVQADEKGESSAVGGEAPSSETEATENDGNQVAQAQVVSVESIDESAEQSSRTAEATSGDATGVATDEASTAAPTALPEGTEAPAQADAQTSVTADAIIMPDAELLIAAAKGGAEGEGAAAGGVEGVQHNAIVGRVLDDALNGGGDGPSLDAVLNALPGGGDQGGNGLEALTSPGQDVVSNGDTADFAGFTAAFTMPTMDEMAVHQDAAPAHG